MAETKFTAKETAENVLTTELNGLTNTSRKTSAAFSNDAATTERFLYADFELSLGTQTARTGSPNVVMYILPEVDGTNYATGSDTITPSSELIAGVFTFPADATAHRTILRGVLLPPSNFKVLIINNTSQTFNATGNTLKMQRYGVESV